MQCDLAGTHHFINAVRPHYIEESLYLARVSGNFENVVFGSSRNDASAKNLRFRQESRSFPFRGADPDQNQLALHTVGIGQV